MDINAYIQQAAAHTDMTKAPTPGNSTYTPPPEGPALFRLTGYVEIGNQRSTYQGQEKIKPQVMLTFDVFGRNYPVQEINGEKVPVRVSFTESLSLHEKANFRKLFDTLRGNDASVTHFAQLLGRPFRGRIFHDKWKNAEGQDRTKLTIKNTMGYQIGPPVAEDPETGEVKTISVPEPVSQIRLFLWNFATKEMWDSLFIDGSYGSGNSKNIYQEKILGAMNFQGSKIDQVINGGEELAQAVALPPKGNGPGAFRPNGVASSRPRPVQAPVVEAFNPVAAQEADDWLNEGQE